MRPNVCCKVVGTVSKIQVAQPVTRMMWNIEDFYLLSEKEGNVFLSPVFIFGDEMWRLSVEPCVHTDSMMYFNINNITRRRRNYRVSYKITIKSNDGSINPLYKGEDDFQLQIGEYGRTFYYQRRIIFNQSFRIRGNHMQIFCDLAGKEYGSAEAMSRQMYPESRDGSTQTEEEESLVSEEDERNDDHKITSNLKGKDEYTQKAQGENLPSREKDELEGHKVISSNSTGIHKLAMNLKDLLDSGKGSDVTLKVRDKEFRAHSSILGARSPVFESMFRQDMAEKNSGEVDISDCDPEAFQEFLVYLYTGNVKIFTVNTVFYLYYIADKYDSEEMKAECVEFMMSNIFIDTFCDVVVLSLKYDESALLERAVDFFAKHLKEIITTVKWQTFLKDNPVAANELHIKAIDYYVLRK